MNKTRCRWVNTQASELYQAYHDEEWGRPVHDDRTLFEFLILEGAQAGLSWATILNKRAAYKEAYDNFDVQKVSAYTAGKQANLLQNAGIVRNKLKVAASITNAKAFIQVQQEFGSFDTYLWQFTGRKPIQNNWQTLADVPVSTPESDALSKDLKKRGFKFVGTTICYAFMQAVGMVNDHTVDCFCHEECKALG